MAQDVNGKQLKVGDKVIALVNYEDIIEGEVYEVTSTFGCHGLGAHIGKAGTYMSAHELEAVEVSIEEPLEGYSMFKYSKDESGKRVVAGDKVFALSDGGYSANVLEPFQVYEVVRADRHGVLIATEDFPNGLFMMPEEIKVAQKASDSIEIGDTVTLKAGIKAGRFSIGTKYKVKEIFEVLGERRIKVEQDDDGKASGWLADFFNKAEDNMKVEMKVTFNAGDKVVCLVDGLNPYIKGEVYEVGTDGAGDFGVLIPAVWDLPSYVTYGGYITIGKQSNEVFESDILPHNRPKEGEAMKNFELVKDPREEVTEETPKDLGAMLSQLVEALLKHTDEDKVKARYSVGDRLVSKTSFKGLFEDRFFQKEMNKLRDAVLEMEREDGYIEVEAIVKDGYVLKTKKRFAQGGVWFNFSDVEDNFVKLGGETKANPDYAFEVGTKLQLKAGKTAHDVAPFEFGEEVERQLDAEGCLEVLRVDVGIVGKGYHVVSNDSPRGGWLWVSKDRLEESCEELVEEAQAPTVKGRAVKFNVGDKVVCLVGGLEPYIKGEVYEVGKDFMGDLGVLVCSESGGAPSVSSGGYISLSKCALELIEGMGLTNVPEEGEAMKNFELA